MRVPSVFLAPLSVVLLTCAGDAALLADPIPTFSGTSVAVQWFAADEIYSVNGPSVAVGASLLGHLPMWFARPNLTVSEVLRDIQSNLRGMPEGEVTIDGTTYSVTMLGELTISILPQDDITIPFLASNPEFVVPARATGTWSALTNPYGPSSQYIANVTVDIPGTFRVKLGGPFMQGGEFVYGLGNSSFTSLPEPGGLKLLGAAGLLWSVVLLCSRIACTREARN